MAVTQIAVPIVSQDPPLERQMEAARAAGADMVELRVDMIGDAAAVESLLSGPRGLPIILTLRSKEEGGHWHGGEADRLRLIERLGRLRPGFIDLELATWRRSADARRIASELCGGSGGNRLILSRHDFEATPGDLATVFEELADTPADVAKAAFAARDARDSLRVLEQLRRLSPKRDVIAVAMGEGGLSSRVLAGKLGGFLTFASLAHDSESAAGQPTIDELRGRFRWDSINSNTPVFGVIGWPVAHSLSPRFHNSAMRAADIDGVYLPMPVVPEYEAFAEFMDLCDRFGWLSVRGLSVTLPHKEHALRWLRSCDGEVDPLAERIGAVNTLTRTPAGRWRGDNTDAFGILAALERGGSGADPAGCRALIIGAGGAARAAAAALSERGYPVTICNRTRSRAESIARDFGCEVDDWSNRAGCDAAILINCTPVGMWPDIDDSPMPAEAFKPGQTVLDTVYNPAETRLLREAAGRGCRTIRGAAMFVAQAGEQYRIWHGRGADPSVMAAALRVN